MNRVNLQFKIVFPQKLRFVVCVIFGLLLSFVPQETFAAINPMINYQGRLTDSTGTAVSNGSYNMRFKLYTAASGGSPIFTETLTGNDRIGVVSGLFSVMVGSSTAITSVDFNQTLYLSIEIGGTDPSTPTWDGEMSPRKIIGAVPAAFVADTLDNLDSTQFLRSDTSGTLTGNLLITGSSTLQSFTASNSTTTSATTTNIFSSVASSTSLFATSGNIGALTATAITSGLINSQTISSTANFTGTLTATNGLTTLSNLLAISSTTLQNFTATNSTTTNATSTTFAVTTLCLTGDTCRTTWPSGSGGSFAFPWTTLGTGQNATSTTLSFQNGFLSLASSTFTGSTTLATTLLTNATATNFHVSGLASTTEFRTNTGLIGHLTSIFGLFTNVLTNGSSTLQDFTASNGTTTSATSTNFYVSNLASTTNLRANIGNIGNLTSLSFTVSGMSGFGTRCVQTDNNGVLSVAATSCGSGSGGSAGTWSTTTSQVSGQYTNYPNNTTDIVVIGDSSTTTGPIYFDPNIVRSKIFNQYFALSSTTLQNFTATNSTTTNATSTTFAVTTLCLTGDTCRTTWPSGSGGSFAFPWTTLGTGQNATSTTLSFQNGFLSLASSTFTGSTTLATTLLTNATATNFHVSGLASTTNLRANVGSIGRLAVGTTTANNLIYVPTLINFDSVDFNTRLGYQAGQNIAGGAQYNTYIGEEAGMAVNGGSTSNAGYNTAVGYQAMRYNTTGKENTALGFSALWYNTTGTKNTAIGMYSMSGAQEAVNNTAVGNETLYNNTTGSGNVAIGVRALQYNYSATNTVAIGLDAAVGTSAYANQGGVYVGYQSGYSSAASSDYNILVGYRAGSDLTFGLNNIILGSAVTGGTGQVTTGNKNISIGTNISLPSPTASNQLNIGGAIFGRELTADASAGSVGGYIGMGTTTPRWLLQLSSSTAPQLTLSDGDSNHWSFRNIDGFLYLATSSPTTFATSSVSALTINSGGSVGIGKNPTYSLDVAGFINTNANYGYKQNGNTILYGSTTALSIAVGQGAGANLNSSSQYNTALGYNALNVATSTYSITAIGYGALANQISIGSGEANTAVGYNTLSSSINSFYNTAIGSGALQNTTTGSENTAVGMGALPNNTRGSENTAIGRGTMQNNLSGSGNSTLGIYSLYYNITGAYNTVLGYRAMQENRSATTSVAVGAYAGSGSGSYTNEGGTYIGFESGYSVQTGSDYNTLLGYRSGYGITTGARNVLIGQSTIASAYNKVTSGSRNIAIGDDVALPSATASNQLNIGNLIYGQHLTGTGSTVAGYLGVGTTTPRFLLQLSSSTAPQLTLSDGDSNHWSFRNIDGFLYLATSSATTFATTTTPTLVLDPNGRVGIGRNPSGALDVVGTIISRLGSATLTINPGSDISYEASNAAQVFSVNGLNALRLDDENIFFLKGVEKIRMAPGGLGIGTSTPNWLLQLSSSTAPQLTLSDPTTGANHWSFRNQGGFLYLATSSPTTFATTSVSALALSPTGSISLNPAFNALTVNSSGQVGVRTASPLTASTFHINRDASSANSTNGVFMLGTTALSSPSADGTYIGLNALSSFAGNVLDYQLNGSRFLSINNAGEITTLGGTTANLTGSQLSLYRPSATVTVGNSGDTGTGSSLVVQAGAGGVGANLDLQTDAVTRARLNYLGFGIGTSTPRWLLQLSSSTAPQLTLSDGDSNHWSFRNIDGFLYLATSSATTFATSSVSALAISTGGIVSIPNTATTSQLNANVASIGRLAVGTTTANNLIYVPTLINFDSVDFNTRLGYQAGQNIAGGAQYNTYIGEEAGMAVNGGSTSNAGYNTAVGYQAMRYNTTGKENTALGFSALWYNTTGTKNTAIGMYALTSAQEAISNVTIGNEAQYQNRTGSANVAIGVRALSQNYSATSTVAVGYEAGMGDSAYSNQRGVYIGAGSGDSVAIGSNNNTFVGYNSGSANTSGANNTLFGYQAGDNITSGSNNLVIGYNIDAVSATATGTLNFGNVLFGREVTGTGSTVAGYLGVGTTTPSWILQLASSTAPQLTLSDAGSTHWSFRSLGGNLYLATSSPTTFATSTNTAFSVISGGRSGRIGIGTANPISSFHIYQPGAATLTLDVGSGGGTALFEMGNVEGGGAYTQITHNGGDFVIQNNYNDGDNGRIRFRTAPTGDVLTILGGGNVGVGTTTPKWKFQVANSSAPQLTLSDAGTTHWSFRSLGGSLYLATSSATTFATSTVPALTVQTINSFIGIGTTTPGAKMNIIGALCVDDSTPTCANAARAEGTIYSVAALSASLDLAESYPTKDVTLEAGEIVMLDGANSMFVSKAIQGSTMPLVGIVSTNPGFWLGGFNDEIFKNDKKLPIALSGRVPTKVNNEGGMINIGDKIALSSVAGVGKKATSTDYTVGIALEPMNGSSGVIEVFVNLGNPIKSPELMALENRVNAIELNLGSASLSISTSTSQGLVDSILSAIGATLQDGILYIKNLVVETLTVGKPNNPTGITLYDSQTGEPYCLTITNGTPTSTSGNCGSTQNSSSSSQTQPPVPSVPNSVTDPNTTSSSTPPTPTTTPDPNMTSSSTSSTTTSSTPSTSTTTTTVTTTPSTPPTTTPDPNTTSSPDPSLAPTPTTP